MKHLFIKDQKNRLNFLKNENNRIIIKHLIRNSDLLIEQKILLMEKQKKLNKKISLTKLNNRCSLTNRGRSILSKFKLSRIQIREFLSLGLVPGYKKAVW